MVAPMGIPEPSDFAVQIDVRNDTEMLNGPHLASAADSGLHLVVHDQDALVPDDLGDGAGPALRRDDVAALALYRLQEQRRDLMRRGDGLEIDLLQISWRTIGRRKGYSSW